jgi:GT2 family glycosyltransferase
MNVTQTLIIPIHNGSHFIHLFWNSLIPNLTDDMEIIVVDDGSTEPIQKLVPSLPAHIHLRILRNESAEGYSKAVNLGLKEAKGDDVYLLNTDLILGRGSLRLIHHYLREDPRIGVVGAKLVYPQTGKIQHFGVGFTSTRKFHPYTHMPPDHPLLSEPRDFQAVTFALCGFRKEILAEVGYLDERYCNGCEDIDFSLRVKENGYRLVVPPEVSSYHWESLSGESRHLASIENEARFWGDWAKRIAPDMETLVGDSLRHFLSHNGNLVGTDFTIVNLTIGNDYRHIIEVLANNFQNYRNFNFWDYPRPFRNGNFIWLPMTLPLDAIRNPKPFIFIVEEYPQLLQNHYWFSMRQRYSSYDLIVDHYGNVEATNSPNFLSPPLRQKKATDVS